jgi:hypothetical protein
MQSIGVHVHIVNSRGMNFPVTRLSLCNRLSSRCTHHQHYLMKSILLRFTRMTAHLSFMDLIWCSIEGLRARDAKACLT